jgi:chromosome segregation protein
MFLKSLLLRGFKTFADQTEIEFRPEARITAIVGPNGCGKSNLLDATRWVLGEDNPRELRVSSLDSIIFSGTAERKALSMAEISLIFDNSSERLPLPYSEVQIKRRAFREGESEFYINKNLCRLKDIKDLLLDTGMGEGSYSIITQGQVDAILSSKGEERRAVFEEAAGINKYKTRKLSAEKKLIAAEQNILRLSDLKIEVGEHLVSLEEQARSAREYLAVQKMVKEAEIGLSKKLIVTILEKRAALLQELETARQASAEKKETERKEEEQLRAAREELRRLELLIEEEYNKLDREKDRLRDRELDRRFIEGEVKREETLLSELKHKEGEIGRKMEGFLAQAEAGVDFEPYYFKETVCALIEQAALAVNLLSDIIASLGQGQPFTLTGASEREDARRLKMELLEAERKRIEEERQRVFFGLSTHQSELSSFSVPEGSTGARDQMLENIAHLKQKKEEQNGRILQLEERLHQELQSEDASTALKIALAKLEGEMSGLCEKLYLEYNLSMEEVQSQPFEVTNVAKAKSEVERGKKRMRELEPVNLLAIDEFDKTRERLTFLEAQLADLSGARDNLRNLISELDLRAEENFVRTMQQLSQVFSETFSRLFNGGEAKIVLLPGNTALESDVEISVRPAGRKWLPLPQLSGGERALSAIAILFSLLRIRPSPFCFMDEVDAALDEANIGRFTEILKEFSSTSQLIVITHNKRTMAVADQIYGVTMETPGVSKVISMRLAEAAV